MIFDYVSHGLILYCCHFHRCLYLPVSKRCNGSKANPKAYVHREHISLLELHEGIKTSILSIRVLLQRLRLRMWMTATSVPLLGLVQQCSSRTTDNSVRVIGQPYKGTTLDYSNVHHVRHCPSPLRLEGFYKRPIF